MAELDLSVLGLVRTANTRRTHTHTHTRTHTHACTHPLSHTHGYTHTHAHTRYLNAITVTGIEKQYCHAIHKNQTEDHLGFRDFYAGDLCTTACTHKYLLVLRVLCVFNCVIYCSWWERLKKEKVGRKALSIFSIIGPRTREREWGGGGGGGGEGGGVTGYL